MGYLKKKAGTATVIVAIGAGTAAGIYAYQKDTGFTPSSDIQKLHANKVDFSQNDDVKSKRSQENGSDNEKSAMLDQSSLTQTDAAFLFSQAQLELPPDAERDLDQALIVNNNQSDQTPDNTGNVNNTASNIIGPNPLDNVYNVTGDKSNADIIIGGGDNSQGTSVSGNATGDGNGNSGNGNGNTDNDSSNKTDGKNDDTDNNGKDDNNSDNNGGETPTVYPSDKVTNPPPKKNNPSNVPTSDSKNFSESDKDLINSDSRELCIESNSFGFADS